MTLQQEACEKIMKLPEEMREKSPFPKDFDYEKARETSPDVALKLLKKNE